MFTQGINAEVINADAMTICSWLTQAWRMLKSELPLLPENVLLFPLTELRGRPAAKQLGYFFPSRWATKGDGSHEVAIHPGLFSKPEDLLLVLVHEAVHGLLHDQKGGCSADGYYHRKEFRNRCLDIGLACDWADTRHGWNLTRWPDETVPECYRGTLEHLREQIQATTFLEKRVPHEIGRPLPSPGRMKLKCGCLPPRIIYVTRGVVARGGIRCDLCQYLFDDSAEK